MLLITQFSIFLKGRDFPFSSCGRFFNALPAKHKEESKEHLCDCLVSNFDYLLDLVSNTVSSYIFLYFFVIKFNRTVAISGL